MRMPATEPWSSSARNTGRTPSMRVRGRSRAETTQGCVPLRYQSEERNRSRTASAQGGCGFVQWFEARHAQSPWCPAGEMRFACRMKARPAACIGCRASGTARFCIVSAGEVQLDALVRGQSYVNVSVLSFCHCRRGAAQALSTDSLGRATGFKLRVTAAQVECRGSAADGIPHSS
jgi:hypothetical protein